MKILLTLTFLSFGAFAEVAVFAGGCFWCMEPPFEKIKGVKAVISGYTGGQLKQPTYEQVSSGKTKHLEAVQVIYDPKLVSYQKLINVFWLNIDPTDDKGQFVDRGYQYTTAIFYSNDEQKKIALASKANLSKIKTGVVTPIKKLKPFYPAEDYHQDFYKKSLVTKLKYKYYRNASGRDDFINKYWSGVNLEMQETSYSKPSKDELKKILTPIQFKVTQKDGTERPFQNEYWDNKKEGIYVDIVSGEPLFSSTDKYKSGTGWPSFTKPLVSENIVTKVDKSLFSIRTEVRSKNADSHLGHVFDDGPKPSGKRYCLNSAALKFIPKEQLKEKGFEKFLVLFKK